MRARSRGPACGNLTYCRSGRHWLVASPRENSPPVGTPHTALTLGSDTPARDAHSGRFPLSATAASGGLPGFEQRERKRLCGNGQLPLQISGQAASAPRFSTRSESRTVGGCGGTTRLRAGSFSDDGAAGASGVLTPSCCMSVRIPQMLLSIARLADQDDVLTFFVSYPAVSNLRISRSRSTDAGSSNLTARTCPLWRTTMPAINPTSAMNTATGWSTPMGASLSLALCSIPTPESEMPLIWARAMGHPRPKIQMAVTRSLIGSIDSHLLMPGQFGERQQRSSPVSSKWRRRNAASSWVGAGWHSDYAQELHLVPISALR